MPPNTEEITGGIFLEGGHEVHYNTFYDNGLYDVVVHGANDTNRENNYFATDVGSQILARIYDFYDDSTRGEFLFNPFLSTPDPNAPIAPPLGLTREPQSNGSMLVSWDAPPSFATGWGYKVYCNETGFPPFDGTGQPAGNSPIDVSAATSLLMTVPLPANVTVTVYDMQGHESWYALPLLISSPEWSIYLPFTIQ
ncbi:MAG: hypothetical protein H6636_12575 [Anaerolineales bacterium]|nr:hypothetical protein [Anaerolineales bacterium]